MPFVLLMLIAMVWMQSCKSTRAVAEGEAVRDLPARQIIKRHYKNELDFKTVVGRMHVNYDNGSSSQGVNLSFRMEKDKAIWLSATMNLAKVYITPERVSFYNKLDNSYFDGDFTYLSHLLGTELDFEKVQNMLLGQAMFNLRDDSYNSLVVNNNYQLKPVKDMDFLKVLFQVEPANFKIGRQLLSEPEAGRQLDIEYKTYQQVAEQIFPEEIGISARENGKETRIDIKYRNIEFNRKVRFPYSIPKGYKEINLKGEL
ncbi:DUF4292 domain-containing protein [Sinomicrobium sp. FJxs]|uniref:DUF4292 domain-containing protein n=2 Tax=Sinomicrobium weinanense TaxID=2842200 RepID=A0A926PZP0_9FLAO|nr:DUF4292 domain-containing protein [Sinomicrobium weinanense]MBU3124239.1 DUF4292 domain-containing protein [Sinomicrobium weinanense]